MAEPKEPLTERELEVVRLLATGVGNKEIAAQLHVSPNTIRVHLRNIFTKLEAQSRTEVTMIAVRNGWVVVDEARNGHAEASTQVEMAESGVETASRSEQSNTSTGVAAVALTERIALVQPAQPIQPVPVAPNPQLLPSVAVWQRVALIIALITAAALTATLLQRPTVEASAQPGDVLLPDSGPNLVVDTSPVEGTRWYPRASIRTARSRPAIAVANGMAYVIGGEVNRAPSDEILIYDPKADAWRDGGRKPTPVMNTGATVIGDVLYMPGGTTADSLATDRFEALDLTTGEWKVLPSLPRPLTGQAVAAFGGRLFVVGGRTPNGTTGDSFAFDPTANRWTVLPSMPTPRSQLAAAALNDRIYAVGGYDGTREYSTCEYFQINENKWFPCASMTIPRGGLGLAQVGSALFAVGGGLSNGYIGFNERYDPAADKWVPFEMMLPRLGDWRNPGVASLPTEFYVIGGSTRGVPLSDNYVYEVLNNRTFLPAFQSNEGK